MDSRVEFSDLRGRKKEREAEQRALMVAFDPPGNFPVPGSSPLLPDLSRAA